MRESLPVHFKQIDSNTFLCLGCKAPVAFRSLDEKTKCYVFAVCDDCGWREKL